MQPAKACKTHASVICSLVLAWTQHIPILFQIMAYAIVFYKNLVENLIGQIYKFHIFEIENLFSAFDPCSSAKQWISGCALPRNKILNFISGFSQEQRLNINTLDCFSHGKNIQTLPTPWTQDLLVAGPQREPIYHHAATVEFHMFRQFGLVAFEQEHGLAIIPTLIKRKPDPLCLFADCCCFSHP